MTQFPKRTHRARMILEAVGRAYPTAWTAGDHFRSQRGPGFDWPDWCYLPLAGAYAVVSGGGDNRVPLLSSHHVGILGAMMAWRMGQQIMRFDPALYRPLAETPISGDLPTALLYRLPVWCVYIEADLEFEGRRVHGAWVHLEHDQRGDELRLVLDCAETPELALDPMRGIVPVPLILGAGGIAEALERVGASGAARGEALGLQVPDVPGLARRTAAVLEPLLSLTLYLCSERPDWGRAPPANPEPKRTKRGWRMFPADWPSTWDVGVRLGAALRQAYQAAETGGGGAGGTHAGPRAHVRRAHWHTILSGPRLRDDGSAIPSGERRADLRWMPPIPVNVQDLDQLPATVRRVE